MKFKDIIEGSMVYYHASEEELRYPVKVLEKGYFDASKQGDPFVKITNPLEPGTIITSPGRLSSFNQTHCLGCFRTIDFGMPNVCGRCGRIICPDCGQCHCRTKFDRNENDKKTFTRISLKTKPWQPWD